MTEQKMPARIWVGRQTGWAAFEMRGDTAFVRSDIAERMAKALEESRLQIEYMQSKFEPTGSGNVALARIRDALSAFRSATQDREANR